MEKICQYVDQAGAATEHMAGSDSICHSDINISRDDELICSHVELALQTNFTDLITKEQWPPFH